MSDTSPNPSDFQSSTPHVLEEARRAVYGRRQQAYGHPENNFAKIAALWNAYMASRPDKAAPLAPWETGAMMILLKIARLMETPKHRDSWVDIAGYAAATARALELDP